MQLLAFQYKLIPDKVISIFIGSNKPHISENFYAQVLLGNLRNAMFLFQLTRFAEKSEIIRIQAVDTD